MMPVEREALERLASALRRDAAAHEAGDYAVIGARLDELILELRTSGADAHHAAGPALTFWDWWSDARNHDWRYYEPIARDDWPRLARHVADALERGTPLTEPSLLRQFELASRPGLLTRLARRLGWGRAAEDSGSKGTGG